MVGDDQTLSALVLSSKSSDFCICFRVRGACDRVYHLINFSLLGSFLSETSWNLDKRVGCYFYLGHWGFLRCELPGKFFEFLSFGSEGELGKCFRIAFIFSLH